MSARSENYLKGGAEFIIEDQTEILDRRIRGIRKQ